MALFGSREILVTENIHLGRQDGKDRQKTATEKLIWEEKYWIVRGDKLGKMMGFQHFGDCEGNIIEEKNSLIAILS